MVINPELIRRSINRLNFNPEARAKKLVDGPRTLTAGQKENRFRAYLAATGDPDRARRTLERFIGGNDLQSINYLHRGVVASKSICRIRLHNAAGKLVGYGTGFLVAPGVVMTNHHVISSEEDAAYAKCDFGYELDAFARECATVSFVVEPQRLCYANEVLDFAIAAVAPVSEDGRTPLSEFFHLPLRGEAGKAALGEYLSIIQHPNGERKQLCVRENKLLAYDEPGNTLWYQTDTSPGSSGSPVFNDLWQVVALHHSGVPRKDKKGNWLRKDGRKADASTDESEIDWIANEGIRISRIVAHLKATQANRPLVQAILNATDPLPPHDHEAAATDSVRREWKDGEVVLNVPIRIGVRIGDPAPITKPVGGPGAAAAAVASAKALQASARGQASDAGDFVGIEKVEVDQTNYNQRNGYSQDFLGAGALRVPLPVVTGKLKNQILNWTYKGQKGDWLKYYNYSVLMNKQRKLAFVAAVNIDGTKLQDVGKRDGDRWFEDPRAGDCQITTAQFYSIQLREADRSLNPFDRGHLVRRLDGTWGNSVALAKRNGDDTFHYPNCSPQFWKFNQGSGQGLARLWAGLEDFALAKAAAGRKLTVLNGPVFDAPRARIDDGDGQSYPNPSAARAADPKLLGISIPRWFWKVLVWKGANNNLEARAYLLSQEAFLDQIEDLEELKLRPLTDAQAHLFRVPIADLEKLTGLNFHNLRNADAVGHELSGGARPLAYSPGGAEVGI